MKTAKEELAELSAKRDAIEVRIAEIYKASVQAPAKEKVCEDFFAEILGEPLEHFKYPITIHGITYSEVGVVDHSRKNVGRFVAVRPCDEHLKNKTFLGIYVGDIALQAGVSFHPETGILEVQHILHNPAIWVPELKRIIFGCGSWWEVLKAPEDLKQITDADIDGIWYVQALKSLQPAL
jgi:hypothetical protein